MAESELSFIFGILFSHARNWLVVSAIFQNCLFLSLFSKLQEKCFENCLTVLWKWFNRFRPFTFKIKLCFLKKSAKVLWDQPNGFWLFNQSIQEAQYYGIRGLKIPERIRPLHIRAKLNNDTISHQEHFSDLETMITTCTTSKFHHDDAEWTPSLCYPPWPRCVW